MQLIDEMYGNIYMNVSMVYKHQHNNIKYFQFVYGKLLSKNVFNQIHLRYINEQTSSSYYLLLLM